MGCISRTLSSLPFRGMGTHRFPQKPGVPCGCRVLAHGAADNLPEPHTIQCPVFTGKPPDLSKAKGPGASASTVSYVWVTPVPSSPRCHDGPWHSGKHRRGLPSWLWFSNGYQETHLFWPFVLGLNSARMTECTRLTCHHPCEAHQTGKCKGFGVSC